MLMVLSGDDVLDDTHYTNTREIILGVTGGMASGSNLTLVALGQTAKRVFKGNIPEQNESLSADLEEHRDSGFLPGDILSGQLLLYTIITTWDTGGAGANLTIVLTTGTFDLAEEWTIRETIVTVVQLPNGEYSETWSIITADREHYVYLGMGNRSIVVQILRHLICKDASMICATSMYSETDGELLVCRHCSSICAVSFIDGYCLDKCPYYKIKATTSEQSMISVSTTSFQTTPTPSYSNHTSGSSDSGRNIALSVGIPLAVIFIVGFIVFLWYKRRTGSYGMVKTSMESSENGPERSVLYTSGKKYKDTSCVNSVPLVDSQPINLENRQEHEDGKSGNIKKSEEQTEVKPDKQTDAKTCKEMTGCTEKQTAVKTDKQTSDKTDTHTEAKIDKQTADQKETETDKQTTDRTTKQPAAQTDRQTVETAERFTTETACEQLDSNEEKGTQKETTDNVTNVKEDIKVGVSPAEPDTDTPCLEHEGISHGRGQTVLGVAEQSPCRGETDSRLQIEMEEFNSIQSKNSIKGIPAPEQFVPEKAGGQ